MTAATVGLALIARNEEATLPTLLESITGAFDRVVLLDTGSTDRTREVFTQWANREALQRPLFTFQQAGYEWRDDFADARNAADRLLAFGDPRPDFPGDVPDDLTAPPPMVDWAVWADCDDELHGAIHLRQIAHQADPRVVAFIFDYAYAHDPHGNCICTLRRERLVRAGASTWIGRVHEAQIYQGLSAVVDPQICRWVHRKPSSGDSNERNLRILHAWNEETPDDPRIVGYLGTEHAGRGDFAEAVGFFEQYLGLKTGWDEERCQVQRKLAACLIAQDRPDKALDVALEALKVMPSWPDTYLSLAQATYHLGEFEKSVEWARETLRRGQPESMLILNPLDYTLLPRVVLAAALGALGRVEEAIVVADEALAIVPDHGELVRHRAGWQQQLKREQTAQAFAAAARVLIEHDEQAKALRLLEECVPYFATDHPLVVGLRSQLRERTLWATDPVLYAAHYRDGGSKPEDGVPDDQIDAICGRLPRAGFLADGLREQLAEAA